MKRILKTLSSIILIVFLATPVKAVVPVVVGAAVAISATGTTMSWGYLGASIALNTALFGGLAYTVYQNLFAGSNGQPGSGGATVTPSGTLGRQSTVQWVDLSDLDVSGIPQIKQKDLTVKLSTSEMRNKVKQARQSDPNKYPALAALDAPKSLDEMGSPLPAGSIISSGGKYYYILSDWSGAYAQTGTGESPNFLGSGVRQCAGWHSYYNQPLYCQPAGIEVYWSLSPFNTSYKYAYQSVRLATPAEVAERLKVLSPEEYAAALAGRATLDSPAAVFSDYLRDIDDYIKEFPGSVSVIEGSHSGVSDSAPPATLPTPATQAGYDAAVARAGAAAASGSARNAAEGAVTTAQGNYNSNPTAENLQKVKDAELALEKLKAEQAEKDAQDAEKKLAEEESEGTLDGSGFGTDEKYGDQEKDFDLGNRFKTFFDQMKTTAVFSLPNEFLTNIPNSSETSISFDGGRFGVQTFDFATFASLWNGLKSVILVVFGWFSIRIAILKGGSS